MNESQEFPKEYIVQWILNGLYASIDDEEITPRDAVSMLCFVACLIMISHKIPVKWAAVLIEKQYKMSTEFLSNKKTIYN